MRTSAQTGRTGRERIGGLAAALAVALIVAACGGTPDAGSDALPTDDAPPEAEEPEPDDGPETDDGSDGDDGTDGGDGPTGGDAGGPTPDADLVADPCAPHQDREMDAFIELAAPVQDQVVAGEVELVGCSNVFEATVNWLLLDGDGVTLDEGFTTAACGTGCVGEFRDTVPLDAAAGEPVVYLQAFAYNMADEGEDQLYLSEVLLVLE
jgi:hypothetical protein